MRRTVSDSQNRDVIGFATRHKSRHEASACQWSFLDIAAQDRSLSPDAAEASGAMLGWAWERELMIGSRPLVWLGGLLAKICCGYTGQFES